METAIINNSFMTPDIKGKNRDKKIASGGLKEVKRNFYLLKMGENFTDLSTVGNEL